jgi:hypothetical protein
MSSSCKKNSGDASEQLVTIATSALKERLNKIYNADRKKTAQLNSFEDLWDMKEMALLEGKASLQVPRVWLDELEGGQSENPRSAKH